MTNSSVSRNLIEFHTGYRPYLAWLCVWRCEREDRDPWSHQRFVCSFFSHASLWHPLYGQIISMEILGLMSSLRIIANWRTYLRGLTTCMRVTSAAFLEYFLTLVLCRRETVSGAWLTWHEMHHQARAKLGCTSFETCFKNDSVSL